DGHRNVFGAEEWGEGHDGEEAGQSEEKERENGCRFEVGQREKHREIGICRGESVHPAAPARPMATMIVFVYWTTSAASQGLRMRMVKTTAKRLTVKERVCS